MVLEQVTGPAIGKEAGVALRLHALRCTLARDREQIKEVTTKQLEGMTLDLAQVLTESERITERAKKICEALERHASKQRRAQD